MNVADAQKPSHKRVSLIEGCELVSLPLETRAFTCTVSPNFCMNLLLLLEAASREIQPIANIDIYSIRH